MAAQMVPYLLFGFLVAGVLSVAVSPEFVEAHMGRRGLWQVVKAALLGVPLPLCSCGVIPVSASLRRHGASKGATLSFLVSTPQTGVDSIMVTHALLGPVFAAVRVAAAFVSGIAAGVLAEALFDRRESGTAAERADCPCCAHGAAGSRARRAFAYGFVTLPREIGRAMLVGMVLSGLLAAIVPENYFADRLGGGFPAMLVMLAVGIPMYVCSSGSVPIAYALMRAGVSPGAALVFLIVGPATNAATVTTVWKMLGRGVTAVYLLSLSGLALAAGALLDALSVSAPVVAARHVHPAEAGWFGHAGAVVLLVMLAPALLPRRRAGPSPRR